MIILCQWFLNLLPTQAWAASSATQPALAYTGTISSQRNYLHNVCNRVTTNTGHNQSRGKYMDITYMCMCGIDVRVVNILQHFSPSVTGV